MLSFRNEEEISEFKSAIRYTVGGALVMSSAYTIAVFMLIDAADSFRASVPTQSTWMGIGHALGLESSIAGIATLIAGIGFIICAKSWDRLLDFEPQEEANTSFSREN